MSEANRADRQLPMTFPVPRFPSPVKLQDKFKFSLRIASTLQVRVHAKPLSLPALSYLSNCMNRHDRSANLVTMPADGSFVQRYIHLRKRPASAPPSIITASVAISLSISTRHKIFA